MKTATDDAPANAGLGTVSVIAGAAVAIDQLTKAAASHAGPSTISRPAMNVDFSLAVAGGSVLTEIVITVMAIVVFGGYALRRASLGTLSAWVPAALIGGAVSNLADRVVTGGVRDFLVSPWVLWTPRRPVHRRWPRWLSLESPRDRTA